MPSISKAVHLTFRNSRLSAEQLAEGLGMSARAFYSAMDPTVAEDGEKRSYLKPHQLPTLMELTGDYRILHALANQAGFVAFKIPRARRLKPEEVIELQKLFIEISQKLLDFVQGETGVEETTECVNRGITRLAQAREMVKASNKRQPDLFGEE